MHNTVDQLLELAHLTDAQARALAGVSARQWRRYRSGATPLPDALQRLLAAVGGGLLGEVRPEWSGWRLAASGLVSPTGEVYPVAWFAGLHWHLQQLAAERAALRGQVAALEKENARLRGQSGAVRCRPRRRGYLRDFLALTTPPPFLKR